MTKNCCRASIKQKKCIRYDNRLVKLYKQYTKYKCLRIKNKHKKCNPFLYCSTTFNVYTNQNPKNTISIKYRTFENTQNTISKLEHLYKIKKYSHKRIWQVAMILMVRLRILKNKQNSYKLSKKYLSFLKKRTKLTGKFRYMIKFFN